MSRIGTSHWSQLSFGSDRDLQRPYRWRRIKRNPSCRISAEMHQPCGTNSPYYRCFRPTTDGGISTGIRDAGRHRWASCALGKNGATTRQMAIQGAGGASKAAAPLRLPTRCQTPAWPSLPHLDSSSAAGRPPRRPRAAAAVSPPRVRNADLGSPTCV
jgi:hypothetical protein